MGYSFRAIQIDRDTQTSFNLLVKEKICPSCGSTLITGDQLFEQVINREECPRFKLTPLESKELAIRCPNCQKEFLKFIHLYI